MFNATCDFSMDSGISHYTNKVYDFELGIGSSDTWPRWQGGDYPVVVEYESFCGRYSLEVHTHTHTRTHARTHTHKHTHTHTHTHTNKHKHAFCGSVWSTVLHLVIVFLHVPCADKEWWCEGF